MGVKSDAPNVSTVFVLVIVTEYAKNMCNYFVYTVVVLNILVRVMCLCMVEFKFDIHV